MFTRRLLVCFYQLHLTTCTCRYSNEGKLPSDVRPCELRTMHPVSVIGLCAKVYQILEECGGPFKRKNPRKLAFHAYA